jgi:hypothetical protein
MAWIYSNPNPFKRSVSDCAVRALSVAECLPWHDAYFLLCVTGAELGNLPDAKDVFRATLRKRGYKRHTLPDTCPDCYTLNDFCVSCKRGTYIVGVGDHVVAVIDGNYYDTWDSGDEIPLYFYSKEN